MSLISCAVNLVVIGPSTCGITNSTSVGTFAITNTNIYVPDVTLSTQIIENYYNN